MVESTRHACGALPPSRNSRTRRGDRTSDAEGAGADQIRQLGALLGVQDRMDLLQGLDHGVPEPLRARYAELRALVSLGAVERITGDCVRQRRDRSPPIDLALRPL